MRRCQALRVTPELSWRLPPRLVAAGRVRTAAAAASAIDVQDYAGDIHIDPMAQTLAATVTVHFLALDDATTVSFELNNALSLDKVTDEQGRQIQASRLQEDMSVRLTLPQPIAERSARHADVHLRREAHRRRRIARVRNQVRRDPSRLCVSDVSGAMVSGERLHRGPLQLRSESHRAGRLQSAGQRHRLERARAGRHDHHALEVRPSLLSRQHRRGAQRCRKHDYLRRSRDHTLLSRVAPIWPAPTEKNSRGR